MSHRFSSDLGLKRLHELISDHPDFEFVAAPGLDVYCFRYVPNGLAERQDEPEVQRVLDQLNQEIVEAVRRSGHALVKTLRVGGYVTTQVAFSSADTLAANVEETFESIARWGRLLHRKLTVEQVTT